MEQSSIVFSMACLLASLSFVSCDLISMGTMIDWEDSEISSIWQAMGRFNEYGCYCGFGGQGYPVDKIDCCCQIHDECYDNLAKEGTCASGHVGVGVVYKYSKINSKGTHSLQCRPNADACADGICACDKALAECFSTNESSYENSHKSYDRKAHCDGVKGLRAEFCPNFDQ